MYKIWIIGCLILSVVFSVVEISAAESKPTIRSAILPGAYYLKQQEKEKLIKKWKMYKEIGLNYLTVCCYWSGIERKSGEYDFSELDHVLQGMRAAGLKAIVRLEPNEPPGWIWTYGKKTALTNDEAYRCVQAGNKIDYLDKLSVYPALDPDGTTVGSGAIDPWDATGNYLKLRFRVTVVKYLQEKYADVVEYVHAGQLGEGNWALGSVYTRLTATWAPTALDAYRRYLQEKYMDVKDANKVYNTNWKSFWEAVPPKTYEDTKYFWDWHKFLERGLVALFMRESAIVRRAGFKVAVLCHFIGIDSRGTPFRPNPGVMLTAFNHPGRIELIDADLYVIGGGYDVITWHDEVTYDPYSGKNPLVLVQLDGIETLRKKTGGLYIVEDWGGNDSLLEFLGLNAAMVDGFQIIENTWELTPPTGKTPEEMFEKFKEALRTFWVFNEQKNK